jgi:hypothetical protein
MVKRTSYKKKQQKTQRRRPQCFSRQSAVSMFLSLASTTDVRPLEWLHMVSTAGSLLQLNVDAALFNSSHRMGLGWLLGITKVTSLLLWVIAFPRRWFLNLLKQR